MSDETLNVEIWKCGDLRMWKFGDVKMWKCENLEIP